MSLTLAFWTHTLAHYFFSRCITKQPCEIKLGLGKTLFKTKDGSIKFGLIFFLSHFKSLNDDSNANKRQFFLDGLNYFSGIFFSFILSLVFFFLVSSILPRYDFVQINKSMKHVGEILDNSPAQRSELKINDKILEVNNTKILSWADLTDKIQNSKGPIKLTVERDGKTINVEVFPELNTETQTKRIGIVAKEPDLTKYRLPYSFKASAIRAYHFVKLIAESILDSMTGTIYDADNTIRILAKGNIAQKIIPKPKTLFALFLYVAGFYSLILSLYNLIPIPPFDFGNGLFRLFGVSLKTIKRLRILGLVIILGFYGLHLLQSVISLYF